MEAATFGNGGQVYRWAKRLYGKERVSDITAEEIGFVAFIWFGSLAFVVACVGPMTAFGSLVISNQPTSRRKGLLRRSIRRFFVNARRRHGRVKTVEVEKQVEVVKEVEIEKTVVKEIEKEVPVEKVVIRKVEKEVPVEKVVIREVEKEVPVDKVVFKEVPKEIIKREYVYVPVGQDPMENGFNNKVAIA